MKSMQRQIAKTTTATAAGWHVRGGFNAIDARTRVSVDEGWED